MAKAKTDKCQHCDRPASNRNVCRACYQAFVRAVASGETTWQELEDKGIVGPTKKSPARKALEELSQ